MVTRREVLKLSGMAAVSLLEKKPSLFASVAETPPDYSLTIGPHSLEVAPRKFVKTTAYNDQVPGPLLRFREGAPVSIRIDNHSADNQVVHWHGLFLPPEIDGAMEEGTPPIAPGKSASYTFTPEPSGLRWYHTHVMAGHDLKKGLYSGQFGVVWIEPRENPGRYDQEFFLTLHDWNGSLQGSDDGSMTPLYDVSTINGRTLGFGEPLRVKNGQRIMLHIVNTSATDPHWLALPGHSFRVLALDGNPVPSPQQVEMLHLSPAERISVEVTMNHPGVWVLGEVRKHVQAAGMGVVIEYADAHGKPVWQQPQTLHWDYIQFGATDNREPSAELKVTPIPLTFESRFTGHGAMDQWMINGKSFPDTETIALERGNRYRLIFKNKSQDDHPVHLHRSLFEVRRIAGRATSGILKDTILVKAGVEAEVEVTANAPGLSLFHCHQQDHMDMGFMMLFRCS